MIRPSASPFDEECQDLPRASRQRARWLARVRLPAALALGLLVAGGLPPKNVPAPPGVGPVGGWIAVRDEEKRSFVRPSADVSSQLVQWAARQPRPERRAWSEKAEQRVAAPAGGVRLHLDDRFLSQIVARPRSDGSLEIGCGIPTSTSSHASSTAASAASQEARHD